MLIHGDNLLALKALEQDYAGKVKCIYIDPPYNTGARINSDGEEIGYDDGLEHSTWLKMMHERLQILKKLLDEDGAIFVHLDDNEADYCKVLMDEIFERRNFMNRVTIDARSPSAFSTVNPGMFVASEYILYYAKNRKKLEEKQLKTVRTPDTAYNKYVINKGDKYSSWKYISVGDAFSKTIENLSLKPDSLLKKYHKFIIDNADSIFRFTAISDSGAGKKIVDLKRLSMDNAKRILMLERDSLDDVYILNGQQISFYSKNIKVIDGQKVATKPLTDIWSDIAWEGIAKEGAVIFKKGKKPEKLIKRCIDLVSNPGDLVVDSFLGSGTTAAVAHKMGRRFIGIEMGDHAYTHCKARLDKVISGEDQGGISKSQNWKGGGGYKFYELAPTLIVKDQFGQAIINPEYNADMLAATVAKHENYTYCPDTDKYWKQGRANEQAYIYTTTQHIDREVLDRIAADMIEGEFLLVACKSFDPALQSAYPNIVIKKIPKMLLSKCEYGKENYNLNIIELPDYDEEEECLDE